MTSPIIALAEWIELEIKENPFGRVAVSLEIHNGVISRIEKTTTEKIKPEVLK